MVKGSVDTVAIFFKQRRVAEQRRLWTREDVSFDPRHYLALLERKPGALDHARPLENWDLPKCFGVLRRRLEGQLAGMGTREYIGVLRLLEKHPLGALTRAVTKGLRCGGLTRDAIAQFLLPQEPWGETTFRLDGREHLRRVQVSRTDVSAYAQLLATPAGGLS